MSVISLEHVSKLYNLQKQKTFKEFLPALLKGQTTQTSFWALDDISFQIKRGESFGIIGPNGSGKSTLLKLIAGVSQPSRGRLTVQGRIAPLIELGAGFHPELTGRENIFLNGVIMGLSRAQLRTQIDSIIDFAELRDFIDQPIKHYSSGMYLRLAFAVATHIEPEILLIDEILAVGDASFREKSRAKMDDFKRRGKTIVFISHALSEVESFCERVAYLKKGKLIALGPASHVIARYNQETAQHEPA